MSNVNTEALAQYISDNEGYRESPYFDTEQLLTIGIGTLIDDSSTGKANIKRIEEMGYDLPSLREGYETLSREDALELMQQDMDTAISDAQELFSNFDNLTQERQIVLADMAYNLGKSRLAKFEDLIGAVEGNRWDDASDEIENSEYYSQVKDRGVRNRDTMANSILDNEKANTFLKSPKIQTASNAGVGIPPMEEDPQMQLPDYTPKTNAVGGDASVRIGQGGARAASELGYTQEDSQVKYERMAKERGVKAVREDIASKYSERQQESKRSLMYASLQDPNVAADSIAEQMRDFNDIQYDLTALEKLDVSNEVNVASADSEIAALRDTGGDAYSRGLERETRRRVIENSLAPYRYDAQQADFGDWAGQIGTWFSPLDALQKTSIFGSVFWGSKAGEEVGDQIWGNMPIDQIPDFIDGKALEVMDGQILGTNPLWTADVLGISATASEEQLQEEDLWNLFDVGVTGVTSSLKVLGLTRSISNISSTTRGSMKLNNTEAISDDFMKGISTVTKTPEEAVEAASPFRVSGDDTPSAFPKVKEKQDLWRRMAENAVQEESREATQEALNQKLGQMAAEYRPGRLMHSSQVGSDMDAVLGTSKGNPFSRKQDVIKLAQSLGLAPPPKTRTVTKVVDQVNTKSGKTIDVKRKVKEPNPEFDDFKPSKEVQGWEIVEWNGGYGLQVRSPVNQFNSSVAFEDAMTKTPVFGLFRNQVDEIDTALVSEGRLGAARDNRLSSVVQKIGKQTWGRLNKGQQLTVAKLLQKQQDEALETRQWWSSEEFVQNYRQMAGKLPTEAEIATHIAHRDLNDLGDFLRNKQAYTAQHRAGYGTATIKSLDRDISAKKARPSAVGKKDAVALPDGSVRPVSREELDELLEQDYQLLEIAGSDMKYLVEDGKFRHAAQYMLAKGDDIQMNPLRFRQTAYLPGGPRKYKAKAFLRQEQIGTYDDGVTTYRAQDRTFFGADTFDEAIESEGVYNRALATLRNYRDELLTTDQANDEIMELGLGTADDLWSKFRAKGIDLDRPFVATKDRESAKSRALVDKDFSSETDFDVDLGQRYNSNRRGERLEHVRGHDAEIFDPMTATGDAIARLGRHWAYDSMKETALKKMRATYGRWMDLKGASITEVLDAVPRNNAPATVKSEIRNHQTYLKRLLGYQTEAETKAQEQAERLASWMFKGVRGDNIARFYPWGTKAQAQSKAQSALEVIVNPFDKLKSIGYHAALGMFNPATLILQASQAALVTSISPKFGMRSMTDFFAVRAALQSDDPDVWKLLKEKDFSDIDYFDDYIQSFKAVGADYYGKNLHYIQGQNGSQLFGPSGALTKGAKSFRDAGTVFFETGDMFTRVTAHGIAYRTGISRGLKPGTKELRRFVSDETNRLTLGMTGADVQRGFAGRGGLSGLFSTTTQFWSFPFRQTASLFSKDFTGKEKTRLLLAQFGLFGTAGIPIVDGVADWMVKSQGIDMTEMDREGGLPIGTTSKAFTNGIIDAFLYTASNGELDANFSGRAGNGAFWTELYRDFMEEPSAAILGGASVRTGHGGIDGFFKVARAKSLWTVPSVDALTDASVAGLVGSVGSVKTAYRAYVAYTLGNLLDSAGGKLGDVTKSEALALFAGIPPQEYEDVFSLIRSEGSTREIVRSATAEMKLLYSEYYEELDKENSDKKTLQKLEKAIELRGLVHKEGKIWDLVHRNLVTDLTSDTLMRDKANRAIMRQQKLGETPTMFDPNLLAKEQEKLTEE